MAPSRRNLACWSASIQPSASARSARGLRDGPPLARGEGLAEEREIRERGHGLDAGLGLEAVAQGVEIELGFQVVHAGLEHRLAVERDPEPDRPRPGQVGKGLVAEVMFGLLGGEVEVGEDHDAGRRVLEHLGAPAGMGPGVEPLAELEPQRGEQVRSRAGRTAASSGTCDGRDWPSPVPAGPAGPSAPGPPGSATASIRARPRRPGGRPGRASRPARSRGRGWPRWRRSPPRRRRTCASPASQRSRAARASRAACGFIRPCRASSPGNGSNPR